MTFDPTHDKLPDLPVTIGGDKSAAAWHPNRAPEVPHADLIARLLYLADVQYDSAVQGLMRQAANALAALGDTVPREDHDQMRADRFSEGWTSAHAHFTPQITTAERQRDEARAERDALAHVIEQVRKLNVRSAGGYYVEQIRLLLDSAPSVVTAEVNAEIWDAGVRAAGGYGHEDTWTHDMSPFSENPYRNRAE